MAFTLPELPYAKGALAPQMSEETLDFHHGKHHNAYVTKANALVEGTQFANASLEDVIREAEGGLFNQVAQIWNHSFFWNCLTPGGSTPDATVTKALEEAFGSVEAFKEKFTNTAIGTFGSGWAWLVKKADGSLDVASTSNAGTPLTNGDTALLTCDVWEHAYYIDYRNARPKYLEAFWQLANWDFVANNLDQ